VAPVDPTPEALHVVNMRLVAPQLDYLLIVLEGAQTHRAVTALLKEEFTVGDFPEVVHHRLMAVWLPLKVGIEPREPSSLVELGRAANEAAAHNDEACEDRRTPKDNQTCVVDEL
jgi:hypothetical protein